MGPDRTALTLFTFRYQGMGRLTQPQLDLALEFVGVHLVDPLEDVARLLGYLGLVWRRYPVPGYPVPGT